MDGITSTETECVGYCTCLTIYAPVVRAACRPARVMARRSYDLTVFL